MQVLERRCVGRAEKPFNRNAAGPFGSWVWDALQAHERKTNRRISIEVLADEGGFDYSHLHGVIKGRRGQPVSPRSETVKKLIETLERMGVEIDAQEGMRLADIVPEGYRIVKDRPFPNADPPENYEDWPAELRQALSYTRNLPENVQRYIYNLWLEQSRLESDHWEHLEQRRHQAEQQLIERQKRIDAERRGNKN